MINNPVTWGARASTCTFIIRDWVLYHYIWICSFIKRCLYVYVCACEVVVIDLIRRVMCLFVSYMQYNEGNITLVKLTHVFGVGHYNTNSCPTGRCVRIVYVYLLFKQNTHFLFVKVKKKLMHSNQRMISIIFSAISWNSSKPSLVRTRFSADTQRSNTSVLLCCDTCMEDSNSLWWGLCHY